MSSKRAKLTVDKARERITSLEESIVIREQKLEQLLARLDRVSQPEEKLLKARERLERRISLERDQVQKLRRLLTRRESDQTQDSSEFFGSEEIDGLHRSFEEVRQDLSQVKMRLEHAELPRDLPTRLSSFEERIGRREAADSDLFTQILALQTALDQERQTVRKLSRRIREQDQNLDALRDAVEDSVVATVDLAERLEELEEKYSDEPTESPPIDHLLSFKEEMDSRVRDLTHTLNKSQEKWKELEAQAPRGDEPGPDFQGVFDMLEAFEARLSAYEAQLQAPSNYSEPETVQNPTVQERNSTTQDRADFAELKSDWIPAKFGTGKNLGRLEATFTHKTPETAT